MAARKKASGQKAGPVLRRRLTGAERVMLQEQFATSRASVTKKDARRLIRRGVPEAEELARATPGWKVNLASQVKLLFDMLRAWWRGRVDFPKATAFAITAALLYFINPLDLVPDILPVAGLIDDATVIAACIRLIQSDLRAYCMDRDIALDTYGL